MVPGPGPAQIRVLLKTRRFGVIQQRIYLALTQLSAKSSGLAPFIPLLLLSRLTTLHGPYGRRHHVAFDMDTCLEGGWEEGASLYWRPTQDGL